LDASAP